MACDGTSLYVADTGNHRVQKLRLADGAHLGTVGNADCTGGRGEGQLHFPYGLCVAAGALYVCDCRNNRIVVLGTDLAWRYTIGRYGSGDGEFFDLPSAVAAHGGELYVADSGKDRIQAAPRAPPPLHLSTTHHRASLGRCSRRTATGGCASRAPSAASTWPRLMRRRGTRNTNCHQGN